MKISQLPPGLKELAEKRRAERHPDGCSLDLLLEAFGWRQTPEKQDFWYHVNSGNFAPYYGCNPVNIRPKNK